MTSNLSFVLATTTNTSSAATTKVLSKSITAKSSSVLPTPEFSRLPPDGHEFPPNFQEVNDSKFSGNSTDKMSKR